MVVATAIASFAAVDLSDAGSTAPACLGKRLVGIGHEHTKQARRTRLIRAVVEGQHDGVSGADLCVVYQPVFCLDSGELLAVEHMRDEIENAPVSSVTTQGATLD